jgi:23S rRNA (uridine2552-2'-O)-methyltransferase
MPKVNKRWLQQQQRDPFVRQARQSQYRSRAVFKLLEIDERDRLFRPGQIIVDLGSAPGSWSQYAGRRAGPHGRVIAVDLLPMDPVENVHFVHGDFSDPAVFNRCLELFDGRRVDLVISDMAPNLTGIRATDQARSMHLAELACDFAARVLAEGGDLLLKLFQGPGSDALRADLIEQYQKVTVRKPQASRDASREFYVLARGYEV